MTHDERKLATSRAVIINGVTHETKAEAHRRLIKNMLDAQRQAARAEAERKLAAAKPRPQSSGVWVPAWAVYANAAVVAVLILIELTP